MSHKYFIGTVALVVIVAILNVFAYQFYWYWRFWWFDMIMHTLGGAWVTSFVLWYRFYRNNPKEALTPSKTSVVYLTLVSVLAVGIGWELFEFSVDTFISFSRHDPVDTSSDIFFDVLGSCFAVVIFFLVYNKHKASQ